MTAIMLLLQRKTVPYFQRLLQRFRVDSLTLDFQLQFAIGRLVLHLYHSATVRKLQQRSCYCNHFSADCQIIQLFPLFRCGAVALPARRLENIVHLVDLLLSDRFRNIIGV